MRVEGGRRNRLLSGDFSSDILAQERGTRRKRWAGHLPVALIFPNSYRVAASNLGFQLVYQLLNRHPALVAERFVLSPPGSPPRSLESNRPLSDFSLICYSLSFEGDTLELLRLLAAGGVEIDAARRGEDQPLVLGGGVATWMNPEPLAVATDLFLIGEAEAMLDPLLTPLIEYLLSSPRPMKEELLHRLAADFPGCYAPRFYRPRYHRDGRVAEVEVSDGLPKRIKPVLLHDPAVAGYSRLLSPLAEFSDLFLVELGRGCSRGCRFCAAGFIYRPPRRWSSAAIAAALAQIPEGVTRVGLLGMEMTDRATLDEISQRIAAIGCKLSFSSLRADALTPELLSLLGSSGVKSAVLAPDGASQRLRRIINKNLAEEDILQAAEALTQTGIGTLKLYCMLGLPEEGEEDLEELVEMLGRLRKNLLVSGRARGRLTEIQLSVSSFVPKPWTPFQYHPFAGVAPLRKRLQFLRRKLSAQANLSLRAESPEHAHWQALLARGDRRMGEALLRVAVAPGGGNPRQQLRKLGLDTDWYSQRLRGGDELMPWEIIDPGLAPGYLFAEYQKGLGGDSTPPCPERGCGRCGVCLP